MAFERADADYLLRVLDLEPDLRARLAPFRAGANYLSNSDRDALRDLVGDRLLVVGFDQECNPTPEGKRLEQLIDDLFTG
jgi:hypothetical protein